MTALPSLFLGLVLIATATDKVVHYRGFRNALATYTLLPRQLSPYLAALIVGAEFLVGLGLVSRRWRRRAALAAAGLLTVFVGALAYNLGHAPGSICGCWFTVTVARATRLHVAINVALLLLALAIWVEPEKLARRRSLTPEE